MYRHAKKTNPLSTVYSHIRRLVPIYFLTIDQALAQIMYRRSCCLPFFVETPLPSRVLYVGECGASKVFLKETCGRTTPYMALSYCWGSSTFLKLTTGNLQAHKEGIDIDLLPLSFRQAVDNVCCLDVKYLWIDALCIIQDDVSDWEVQSSKMAGIHQNSYLVLAMTRLANPDHGCWKHQELATVRIGPIQALMIYHIPRFKSPLRHCFPLLTRAWAFQERILFPRVLHFGPNELS